MRLLFILALAACAFAIPTVPETIPDKIIIPLGATLCDAYKAVQEAAPKDVTAKEVLDVFNSKIREPMVYNFLLELQAAGNDGENSIQKGFGPVLTKMTAEEKTNIGGLVNIKEFTQKEIKLCQDFMAKYKADWHR